MLESLLLILQLSGVHHVLSSFEEASSFSRYHPSKGYFWDFKSQRVGPDKAKVKEEKPREEPSSLFQRKRVDMLLGELIKKFPLPTPIQPKPVPVTVKTEPENNTTSDNKEIKTEVKQEKIKPPPEKKPRLN